MPALESFSRLCTVAELADVNVRQTERHVLMDEPNDQTYACDGGAVILHTERQRQRQRQRQRLAHSLALACNHSYTHTHIHAHTCTLAHTRLVILEWQGQLLSVLPHLLGLSHTHGVFSPVERRCAAGAGRQRLEHPGVLLPRAIHPSSCLCQPVCMLARWCLGD